MCRRAEIEAALEEFGPPYVVKDDGLAAGKGVVVTPDRQAALAHGLRCGRVVVEEFLDGPEVSLFAITDGTTVRAMQPAQDFKRVGDGDTGPEHRRHGGLHAVAVGAGRSCRGGEATVLQPTVDELARRARRSSGCSTRGWP